MMVDSKMHAVFPELPLTSDQFSQLAANRTGAFFSRLYAQKFHLKPGDVFPIKAPGIKRADGTQTWTFKVLGIIDDIPILPAGVAIGNLNYLNESRILADRNTGGLLRTPGHRSGQGRRHGQADRPAFRQLRHSTRSTTEKNAYDTSGSGIDIPFLTESIAGAGPLYDLVPHRQFHRPVGARTHPRIRRAQDHRLFRFRRDGAGVRRSHPACLLGAAIGMALASWIAAIFPRLLPPGIGLPPPYLSPSLFGVALICAVLVAAVSAIIPATRISRLDVATALSGR